MISRVLVPMDDSEIAERALEFALETHSDAEIVVLHVVGVPSPLMGEAVRLALEDDVEEAAEETAEEVFERARELAVERGREITTVVDVGQPAKAILDHTENVDLVVIGSHKRHGASRILTGNVAETVVRQSSVPVTVVE